MSVIAALLIIIAQSAADPINAFRGQPVLSVDFTGAEPDELAELRNLVEIEPGYLLAAVDVQDAVKRIYALDRYSDVRVYATRAQGVVSVTFAVTPIKRLRAIDVHGTSGVSSEGVREATHMRRGDEVDGRATTRMAERALTYLHDEGYPEASVDAAVTSDPSAVAVDVRIDVHEGKPMKASGVVFEGEPRVTYAALYEQVHTRPGKVIRTATLREDRETLLKAYRERGFLRAVVGEPLLRTTARAAPSWSFQCGPVSASPSILAATPCSLTRSCAPCCLRTTSRCVSVTYATSPSGSSIAIATSAATIPRLRCAVSRIATPTSCAMSSSSPRAGRCASSASTFPGATAFTSRAF